MTLQEAAKELNKAFKKEMEYKLEDRINELKDTIEKLVRDNNILKERIDTLEKVIINLTERLDYLESRCR